jgi:glycosyltransferase involved in cell wall biosynthesis
MLRDAVFLTWERHRRTRGLAERLGLRLHEIVLPGVRARRYWGQLRATLEALRNERPAVVFVQNPSLVLTVFVLLWRAVTRVRCTIVMDAHNEAVEPFVSSSLALRVFGRWAIRTADFTIVTNRFLAEKVAALGGRPLVLPDPMPGIVPAPPRVLNSGETVRVLVVATYAKDEPISAILAAAEQLLGRVEFGFTGNSDKLPPSVIALAPANVTFLGFLTDDDYWHRMREAHAVLDLTLMDDCLVCGAYEAVALGRPMVLSDTRALVDYFRSGALYCGAAPTAIAATLGRLRDEYGRLTLEIGALRGLLSEEWSGQAAAIVAKVSRAES